MEISQQTFAFDDCDILQLTISKLSFDRNSDSFSVWGSGSRVNLKPTDGSSTDDWIQRIRYSFEKIRAPKIWPGPLTLGQGQGARPDFDSVV